MKFSLTSINMSLLFFLTFKISCPQPVTKLVLVPLEEIIMNFMKLRSRQIPIGGKKLIISEESAVINLSSNVNLISLRKGNVSLEA